MLKKVLKVVLNYILKAKKPVCYSILTAVLCTPNTFFSLMCWKFNYKVMIWDMEVKYLQIKQPSYTIWKLAFNILDIET